MRNWEQRGDKYFRNADHWDYMIRPGLNWSKWQKHENDTRWERVAVYASLEDAME